MGTGHSLGAPCRYVVFRFSTSTCAEDGRDVELQNALHAVRAIRPREPSRKASLAYRRAELLLENYLSTARPLAPSHPEAVPDDILDRDIRSARTLTLVKKERSPICERWRIVSALQPEDFEEPLRQARVGR